MKSFLIIIALTFLLSFHNFSQEINQVRLSVNQFTLEKQLEIFRLNRDGIEIFKNKAGTITSIHKEILDNGYILIAALKQAWVSSSWFNDYQYFYTYDENNNRTEIFTQTWDDSTWVNYYKDSYSYNLINNLIQILQRNWDGFTWVDILLVVYTYDVNNNNIEILFQTRNGSAWANASRYTISYDNNNNLTEQLIQIWDGSTWNNYRKNSYTYDGNNLRTVNLTQDWVGGIWLDMRQNLYTYNGNNFLIEDLYQRCDSSAWVNLNQYLYSYDGNSNKIEELRKSWDGSAWVNLAKISLTYSPVSSTEKDLIPIKSYSLSNNYPNPFNPTTSIQYAIGSRQFISLKVYDILGIEIETLVNEEKSAGNYELNWNAANLPSGVYFYRLQAGDPSTSSGQSFVQTRKMILLK